MDNVDIEIEVCGQEVSLSVDYTIVPADSGTRDEPPSAMIITIKSIQVEGKEVPDWFFNLVHDYCEEYISDEIE